VAAVGESKVQKIPRGGSRGALTRIFPAVSPGRGGVVRGRLLGPVRRVNFFDPAARGLAADSIQKDMTRMKSNSLLRSLALLAAIALTVPAFAKPVAKTINIPQAAKLGKADLQAGEYRLLIDGNKATVQKGKQVVAESDGRWEDRDAKSSYDAVLLSDNGQVKEVRFSGQKRVFVFNE
jgi:hypothetical protein